MKMPKQHPKRSQKVVNMAPKWAQVGAMLGSKIVLDPPKSEEKTTPKTSGGSGGGGGSERGGAGGGEIESTHLGEGKMTLGGSLLATKTVGLQLPN